MFAFVAKRLNLYCDVLEPFTYSGSLDVRSCDLFTFSISSSDSQNLVNWKRLFIKCWLLTWLWLRHLRTPPTFMFLVRNPFRSFSVGIRLEPAPHARWVFPSFFSPSVLRWARMITSELDCVDLKTSCRDRAVVELGCGLWLIDALLGQTEWCIKGFVRMWL